MKIDFAYIINLTTPDYQIRKKLDDLKFPHNIKYYIYSAVNGWDILKTSYNPPHKFKLADWWKTADYGNKNFYNRNVTLGEFGCMLSHYDCIYSGYRDGFKNILILEEDFYSLGKFPTQEEMDSIPVDASIIYLDRSQLWGDDKEKRINKHITEVGYTYKTHAYIVTRKGMKEIIESPILDNIIASDEFFSAINGTSDRLDAVKIFNNPEFKAYALNGGYIGQTSNPKLNSLTELDPKTLNKMGKTGNSTEYLTFPSLSSPSLLDDSDWGAWCNKYIHPMVRKGEYDLLVDEPLVNCYGFPFFTKEFCDEIIVLAETKEWAKNRHEFYPTTDNLLEVLGMGEIYTRLLNEFIRPLAIWAYGLEGKSWDVLRDESFIIRYRADEQSHLSLHHDYSNLTTLVNLNPGEFEGGGTYFPKYKVLSNPTQIGTMTLHPGNITHKHGARPVLSGTRYVIVSFLKSSAHK